MLSRSFNRHSRTINYRRLHNLYSTEDFHRRGKEECTYPPRSRAHRGHGRRPPRRRRRSGPARTVELGGGTREPRAAGQTQAGNRSHRRQTWPRRKCRQVRCSCGIMNSYVNTIHQHMVTWPAARVWSSWYLRVPSRLDNRVFRTVRRTGLWEDDAIASFYVQSVSSVVLVDTIVPQDGDNLCLFAGLCWRGAVAVLGGGEGHGGHGGEDYLEELKNIN